MQGLNWARSLSVIAALVGVTGAIAQQKLIVSDLGVLPNGIINIPAKINNNGWVVGFSKRIQGQSAWLHNGTSLIDMGNLPGRTVAESVDINRFNRAVGTAGTGDTARPFTWTNGVLTQVAPALFTTPTWGGGINDGGTVLFSDPIYTGFGYAIQNGTVAASSDIDPLKSFFGTAINNRNEAVGIGIDAADPDQLHRTFYWVIPFLPNTTPALTEINALRAGDTECMPNDLTDVGAGDDHLAIGSTSHRVGTGNDQGRDSAGWAAPFLGGVVYLPFLGNDNVCEANGINRNFDIVGRSGQLNNVNGATSVTWHAVIWKLELPVYPYWVVHDAQALLPANTDIHMDNLYSINDKGQMVGTYTRNGAIRSFRCDPVITPIQVTLDDTEVAGGASTKGHVLIDDQAPVGGVDVNLTTNNGVVQVPAKVTVPSNSDNVTFNITTSTVSVSTPVLITAERYGYKSVATLRVQPATLFSITANPVRITGGLQTTARVNLNGNAPANGYSVNLTSSNPAVASIAATVKVPSGKMFLDVPVTTTVTQNNVDVTLTAKASNLTRTVVINVSTPFLEKIVLNQNSVFGGTLVIGTAYITNNALSGGAKVLLKSNAPAVATVPSQIVIPAGQKTGTFPVNTFATANSINVTVTGNFNVSTKTAVLQVKGPQLIHLILNPTTVLGGVDKSKGSVGLDAKAPAAGITVNLSSSDAGAAPPSTVTIPGGATYRQFWITTNIVDSSRVVDILATYLTVTKTAPLTVQGADLIVHNVPSPVAPPMNGSYPIVVTCSVALNRPAQAGGAKVFLDTDDNTVALPPVGVIVPAGQQFINYNLQVLGTGTATITATRGNISIPRTIVAQ